MVRKPGDDESSGIQLPPRPAAEVVAPSNDQAPAEVVRDSSTEAIFDALLSAKERKTVMTPTAPATKPSGVVGKPVMPRSMWFALSGVLVMIVLFWAILKLTNRLPEKHVESTPTIRTTEPLAQPAFNPAPGAPGPAQINPPAPGIRFGQPQIAPPRFNFIRPGTPNPDPDAERRREEQLQLDRAREAEADRREQDSKEDWKARDDLGQPIQVDHGDAPPAPDPYLNPPPAPAPAGPPPVNPAEVYN